MVRCPVLLGIESRYTAAVSTHALDFLVLSKVMPWPAIVLAGKTGLPMVGLVALLF